MHLFDKPNRPIGKLKRSRKLHTYSRTECATILLRGGNSNDSFIINVAHLQRLESPPFFPKEEKVLLIRKVEGI